MSGNAAVKQVTSERTDGEEAETVLTHNDERNSKVYDTHAEMLYLKGLGSIAQMS